MRSAPPKTHKRLPLAFGIAIVYLIKGEIGKNYGLRYLGVIAGFSPFVMCLISVYVYTSNHKSLY
ncbi:MAG: hypothetical protein R3208_14365, partial [Ketobacteraceae bacterium]|nr:hypothetical protein [Ketobacteraceae bacterium]